MKRRAKLAPLNYRCRRGVESGHTSPSKPPLEGRRRLHRAVQIDALMIELVCFGALAGLWTYWLGRWVSMRQTPTGSATVSRCRESGALLRWRNSPANQTMPNPNSTPMNRGRCVTCLKAGTRTSTPRPRAKITLRSITAPDAATEAAAVNACPRNLKVTTASGTSRLTQKPKRALQLFPEH